MSLRARLFIFLAAAFSIGLFWLTDLPLGISGEWTWDRIEHESAKLALLGALQAAVFFCVFGLVAWAGLRQIGTATRKEVACWLLAIMAAGFAWLHAVQDAPPSGWNSAKVPFVLYYPSSSGYFRKARYEVEDTADFLRDYEAIVRDGDVLHEGTHPPGLVVLFRGLLWFTDAMPGVAALPRAAMPESAEEGFDFIRERTAGGPHALTSRDRTVIWLAAMLTQLAAVAVIVPLYFLIRLSFDRQVAWRTVCFWPLVPAVAMFIPKSDVFFSLVSTLLVCLWLYAVRAASRRNSTVMPIALGALAGATGWLGLFCSLAFLPAGAIAVVASVLLFRVPASSGSDEDDVARIRLASHLRWSAKQHVLPVVGGLGCFALLTILVAVAWDLNLPQVWQVNYANHARFYEVSPRPYVGWLLVNPVELALALGAPLAVTLLSCFRRSNDVAGMRFFERVQRALSLPANASAIAVGIVWGLLWLSGKNSGEAARLWIPLMPMALWVGAAAWSWGELTSTKGPLAENESGLTKIDARDWMIVLTVQAVVCLLTVLRVTGFMKERGLVE